MGLGRSRCEAGENEVTIHWLGQLVHACSERGGGGCTVAGPPRATTKACCCSCAAAECEAAPGTRTLKVSFSSSSVTWLMSS